jgi:hypothetical protein
LLPNTCGAAWQTRLILHAHRKYHTIAIDVSTRWNSTYKMLQRVSTLRVHIQAALEKGPAKYVIKLALTPEEWILLDGVISLLNEAAKRCYGLSH